MATRHPRIAIWSVLAVTIVGLGFVLLGPLTISTSRRTLVSRDDPNQAKLLDFFERFGRPDSAIFVISGGDADLRRRYVKALTHELQRLPALEHRIMGQFSPSMFAPLLGLFRPELAGQIKTLLLGAEPPSLATAVDRFTQRIIDSLDGDDGDGDDSDDGGDVDDGDAERGTGSLGGGTLAELARLPAMIDAFSAFLRGEPATGVLTGFMDTKAAGAAGHLDAHGFLTGADGSRHFLVTFPALTSDEGRDIAPIVQAMRAARDHAIQTLTAAEQALLSVDMTGLPALATDELRIVQSGTRQTSIISVLGILLLLYFAFRSFRHTFLALIPLAAGILITLGVTQLLFDGLNLITSTFMSVLMGLGIDFGVHLLHRFAEGQRDGLSKAKAMSIALIHAGPGVATGALTTALAFLTLATTDFTAFAQLGVITAIGLVVMVACAFLLIPALTGITEGGPKVHTPEFPGAVKAMHLVGGAPKTVLALAALLTVASVFAFLPAGPGYNGRYFDFLPKDTESYRGLKAVEEDGAMGLAIVNIAAGSLSEARDLSDRLRALPDVRDVQTPTDLLPVLDSDRLQALKDGVAGVDDAALARLRPSPDATDPIALAESVADLADAFDEVAYALDGAGQSGADAKKVVASLSGLATTLKGLAGPDAAGAAGRGRLDDVEDELITISAAALTTARDVARRGAYSPGDLPPLFQQRFVSKDRKAWAVYAFPTGDAWDNDFSARFSAAIRTIAPDASGLALNVRQRELLIVNGFINAAIYALLCVTLVLLLIFRRVSDAALALFPVIIGWVWMLGAMKPLGLMFNPANMVALPLLMGIGLDAGAHMIHRYRESLADGGARAKLSELVGGTGAAVLVASLTTMAGFGALMFGEYGAMKSLGLLLVLGIGTSLVASIVVLPALLVVIGRAK